jgi:hypothetical protein
MITSFLVAARVARTHRHDDIDRDDGSGGYRVCDSLRVRRPGTLFNECVASYLLSLQSGDSLLGGGVGGLEAKGIAYNLFGKLHPLAHIL